MLYRIVKLTVLPNYCLDVKFEDDTAGTVDLADKLYGEMFEPLREQTFFATATLDEFWRRVLA